MIRRLAPWSLALLVVGAAALDATVLSRSPRQVHANVDMHGAEDPSAATPVEREPIAGGAIADAPGLRLLAADQPRPATRIDVDGLAYTIRHQRAEGAIAVELRAPAGCTIRLGELAGVAPLRAIVPDGAYEAWSSCDPAGTPPTRLRIRADRPGSR